TDTVVYLRIVDGGGHVDLVEAVAILVLATVGIFLFTQAREVAVVVAASTFTQLPENLVQGRLADRLLTLGGNAHFTAAGVVAEVALVLEFLDEVTDSIIIIRELILLIQLIEP